MVSAAAGMVAASTALTPSGNRRQELNRHVEPAGERTLHGTVDPLPDLESGHAVAQLGDGAGEVTADRTRVTRVEAQHIEHVAEVQARGLNPHLHIALVRRRHLALGQTQVVDRATLGGQPGRSPSTAAP